MICRAGTALLISLSLCPLSLSLSLSAAGENEIWRAAMWGGGERAATRPTQRAQNWACRDTLPGNAFCTVPQRFPKHLVGALRTDRRADDVLKRMQFGAYQQHGDLCAMRQPGAWVTVAAPRKSTSLMKCHNVFCVLCSLCWSGCCCPTTYSTVQRSV